MMTKVPTKKATKKTSESPDYFKLPFEVHYSERLTITEYEFKSDIPVKRFKDVKAVHMKQGRSWGASFVCEKNNGPELYCCLVNGHDEVEPPWLSFCDEDDMDINYGCNYEVVISGDEVRFVELTEEQEDEESDEYLDVESMDYCCSHALSAYHLNDAKPDFIILDAGNSNLKIDLDGYALDEENNRIKSKRIINVPKLDWEEYADCETYELDDAKFDWFKEILKSDFPKDSNLFLSYKSQRFD